MSTAEATSYATNVWLRANADVMAAIITAKGGLLNVEGQFVAAPLILAGDWIDVLDLPGHAPTYITGTTYSRAEDTVTITTGSTEQRELVVPGVSSLPQALTAYGSADAYETYDGGGGDYEPEEEDKSHLFDWDENRFGKRRINPPAASEVPGAFTQPTKTGPTTGGTFTVEPTEWPF